MNNSYIEFAKNTALAAGKYLLDNFGMMHYSIIKESIHSIVTKVDLITEELITNLIKQNYSNHNILSEELGFIQNNSEYTWIIDPIDGSSYYSRGIESFSISIALFRNFKPFIGVVYCPILNELFYAEIGKGAFLNNKLIQCSETIQLSESIGSFGHRYLRLEQYEPISKDIIKSIRSIRGGGSSAMELSYLACGRIDLLIVVNQSIWDYAAGVLIVSESGGVFKDLYNNEIDFKNLFDRKLDILSYSKNLDLIGILQPMI